ncbi:hypothetical protein CEXT_708081 [Caerostris extrusa]|uniref:Uncharacterized protein n=1 Tax=Caerostris extrusa TaxID=172846 RepID=A0AAV4UXI7_CAEEX|nr:hypothetical protein CEXT_708081 [Caerostris extrusa]
MFPGKRIKERGKLGTFIRDNPLSKIKSSAGLGIRSTPSLGCICRRRHSMRAIGSPIICDLISSALNSDSPRISASNGSKE